MKNDVSCSIGEQAKALDALPVGVTIFDLDGKILYYNEYCARYVDRKPEYIGKDIRFCHRKEKSIKTISKIIDQLKNGEIEEYYYESLRNGNKLAVTVTPFKPDGDLVGLIQSFTILG